MRYETVIRKIVMKNIGVIEKIEDVDVDVNLQNMGMDSLSFVRVIVEIENLYGFEFPDDKLIFTESGTIKQLCEIVESIVG